MNQKILALLLTVLLSAAGPSFAQSARESTHIVRPGETLAVIAARYEVDLNELAALNGIYNYHRIYSWQELEIPGPSGLSNEETSIVAEDRSHVIRYGETLSMIAERHGVDLTELKNLNDLHGKVIYPGHELLLPSPADASATVLSEPPITAQSRQHIVRHGETLGTIAAAYGLSLNELILVNGIFDHIIYPGQALTLPDTDGRTLVNSETGAPAAEASQPITLGSRLFYIVRPGDTLGDLARHFGITWPAIMRANDIIYPHHIYVGQQLWIPSTGSAGLNVADVEPAPVPDPPTKTVDAETSETPIETSKPAPDGPPPGDYFEHTIQHGETLGILAIHYGLTVQDFLALNNIIHPNHIYVGQQLWIPSTAAAGRDVADVEPAPVPDPPAKTVDAATSETPIETSKPAPDGPPPGDYFEHTIQHGETLGILAIHYDLTVQDLLAANNIAYPYHIYAGQQLWIPSTAAAGRDVADDEPAPGPNSPTETNDEATTESPAETSEPAPDGPPPGDYFEHTIQHGETLGILAIHYGLTVQDLLAANNVIHPNHIYVGQQLWIPSTAAAEVNVEEVEPTPVPDSPTETSDEATTESPAETSEPAPDGPPPGDYFEHTIQFGETLGILAIHYGLTVRDLLAANSIDDANHIESGQTLWIPGSAKRRGPPPPPQLPEPAQQPATEVAAAPAAPAPQTQNAPVVAGTRQQYVVRKGDFLTQLGIDLDTSWIALARLNNLEAPYVLHAGSTLLIPQRADVELYDPVYAAWKWFDIFAHQPGPQVGIGREIVILLDAQAIYAYENGVLQKAVRVSTGKRATPTVKGNHKIWLKRRSQTMSGPGYSLDNVEWVMYFYRDYAIHGTWWHTNFGQPMSHGCVNLTNTDAQWFYEFASLGTPVHVR